MAVGMEGGKAMHPPPPPKSCGKKYEWKKRKKYIPGINNKNQRYLKNVFCPECSRSYSNQ
jgi:hypothetical protein